MWCECDGTKRQLLELYELRQHERVANACFENVTSYEKSIDQVRLVIDIARASESGLLFKKSGAGNGIQS